MPHSLPQTAQFCFCLLYTSKIVYALHRHRAAGLAGKEGAEYQLFAGAGVQFHLGVGGDIADVAQQQNGLAVLTVIELFAALERVFGIVCQARLVDEQGGIRVTAMGSPAMVFLSWIPVSYTHLDVYKRQLYDIKGKLMGQPLYKVLGGSVNQIVTDMTVGIDTPEAMAAEARERVEKDGFTILKIKAGINPIEDIQALTLIRQAVGPNIRLRVDANQGYTVSDAVRTLKAFEKLGVEAVEQCLPSWDLDGMRFVRSKVDLKVMLDESVHTPIDAAKACKIDAADIINIKLMKCGGLYPAEKINAIAEANHVQCMVGCMLETKVAIAAGVGLVAAKQNITEADCDSFMYAVDPEMGMPGGFAVNGGVYTLSDKPGLGIDIDF